jgi:multiple sugar transport system ATP-binding protein
MNNGRIEQLGTPMELFLNPVNTFVAGFLGSPPMNMVKARIVEGGAAPMAEIGGQKIALAPLADLQNSVGRQVVLGMRPEFVAIAGKDAPGRVAVELDLVETLGSEALIYASLAGEPFVIRTETIGQMDVLKGVSGFTIEPRLIRIFDAENGVALAGQDREQ